MKNLETDKIILREFNFDDADDVTRICNNYNIYKMVIQLPYPYSKENAIDWIKTHQGNIINEKSLELAIIDNKTRKLVGNISLININKQSRNAELGYWIDESEWGKGYASEAVKILINYAFNDLNLHKIIAKHFIINPASGKVMQKAGMIYEGTLKEHVLKDGKYMDIVYYGIINPKN